MFGIKTLINKLMDKLGYVPKEQVKHHQTLPVNKCFDIQVSPYENELAVDALHRMSNSITKLNSDMNYIMKRYTKGRTSIKPIVPNNYNTEKPSKDNKFFVIHSETDCLNPIPKESIKGTFFEENKV